MLASHSLRSAWIEIFDNYKLLHLHLVALLTECVDRNIIFSSFYSEESGVALLTECVDRNTFNYFFLFPINVALLTECVDRNTEERHFSFNFGNSRTPYGVRG